MIYSEYFFPIENRVPLFVRRWAPDSAPLGVLHLLHGMAEHAGRYQWFASQWVAQGWLVVAADHRGHGRTVTQVEDLSHFAMGDGLGMVDDQYRLHIALRTEFPQVPHVLFAHSMGSFLGRGLLALPDTRFAAAILSGTAYKPLLMTSFGVCLAKALGKILGYRNRNSLIPLLSMGYYNFRNEGRTPYDWLTQDQSIVDAFLADPLCGKPCTLGFFHELFFLLRHVCRPQQIKAIPTRMPLLLTVGARDPVGMYSSEVKSLHRALLRLGHQRVQLRIYPKARHELCNELLRQQYVDEWITWAKAGIPS